MNTMVMRGSQLCRLPARSRLPTWRPLVPRPHRMLAAVLAVGLGAVLAALIQIGDGAAFVAAAACPVPTESPAAGCPLPTTLQDEE